MTASTPASAVAFGTTNTVVWVTEETAQGAIAVATNVKSINTDSFGFET